jgi:hypothetical protein
MKPKKTKTRSWVAKNAPLFNRPIREETKKKEVPRRKKNHIKQSNLIEDFDNNT